MKWHEMIGKEFGRLTPFGVLNRQKPSRGYMMLCQCQCGRYRNAMQRDLENGHAKSCGCLRNQPRSHGYASRIGGSPNRLYRIWCAMIQRCQNLNSSAFKYYGAKGISVCERWRDFEMFRNDMEPSYQPNLTIHRLSNDLGYCPENCKWATPKEQMAHTSRTRNVTLHGQTKPLYVWADELGIRRVRIAKRIKCGMTPIEALTTPLQKWTRRK